MSVVPALDSQPKIPNPFSGRLLFGRKFLILLTLFLLALAGLVIFWLHPFSRFAPNSLVLEYQGQEPPLSSRDRIPAYTPLKFRLYGSGLMICGQALSPTAQVQYKLSSTQLNVKQVDQLLKQVKAAGFNSLKDQYYYAPSPVGEYQETITLDSGSGPKSVSYFNDGGPKPPAYASTASLISDWCQKATKPYQPSRLRLVTKKVNDATDQEINQALLNGQSIPTFNNERQLFTGALARQVVKTFTNRTHGFFTANNSVYEVALEPEIPPVKVAKTILKKQAYVENAYAAESNPPSMTDSPGESGYESYAAEFNPPKMTDSPGESGYESSYVAEPGYGVTNIYPHPVDTPNAVQYILFCPKQTQQCNGVNGSGNPGQVQAEVGNLSGDAAAVQKFYAVNTGKEFDVAPVKLVYGQHEAQYYRECHGQDKAKYCSDPDQAALINVQDELPSGGKKVVILGFDNPNKKSCGVGEMGGDTAIVRSDGGCNTEAVQAHELGHMLGLEHTPQDLTNVMSGKNGCNVYSAEKATVCQLSPEQENKLASNPIFHDAPPGSVPATPVNPVYDGAPDVSLSTCSPSEFEDSFSIGGGGREVYCRKEQKWYDDFSALDGLSDEQRQQIQTCRPVGGYENDCGTNFDVSSGRPVTPTNPADADCANNPDLEYCAGGYGNTNTSASPPIPGCCAFDQSLVENNPESEYCLATSSCSPVSNANICTDNCSTINLSQGACEYQDHPEYCDGNYGAAAPQTAPNDTCSNEGCFVPPPAEDHGIPGGPDCDNDPGLDYCVRNGITSNNNNGESGYESGYAPQCEYQDHPEYCDGGSYGAGSGESGYEGGYENGYENGYSAGPDCDNDPYLEYCQNNGYSGEGGYEGGYETSYEGYCCAFDQEVAASNPDSEYCAATGSCEQGYEGNYENNYESNYEGDYGSSCEYTDHPEYCQ